ncbi:MAG: hypothetical protein DI570_24645 [Phenylobacterium zucineum]|nr:MAG: hypothetical protein DI570_24645 [Phenylobacterium zucineum]
MADGDVTVKLDAETRRRLEAAAGAAGVSVEDYVRGIIAEDIADDGLAVSRRRLAEYDRSGEFLSLNEAMAHFDHELERGGGRSA